MNMSFNELNLNTNIIEGLKLQGITSPTEVQKLTIPKALENIDIIAESHTGSGKTLAYLCPIFQKINTDKKEMQAIVLIVCAVIFFFLIKSKTLPAEPTIICGFTSLSFFICFSIFDSPIIVNEVIFILEFFASNLICASICITNS